MINGWIIMGTVYSPEEIISEVKKTEFWLIFSIY